MGIRIAINGFGQLGRAIFRDALSRKNVDVVMINDLMPASTLAYLLKYDTNCVPMKEKITSDNNFLYVEDSRIQVFSFKDPKQIPYSEIPVDYVVESSGAFVNEASARLHILGGASRVILAQYAADLPSFMLGINHIDYDRELHRIVSCGSSLQNCIVPILKLIHENLVVESAHIAHLHSVQDVLDSKENIDLLTSLRSNLNNSVVPTSTIKDISGFIPDLKGKVKGRGFAVGLNNVSTVYLTVKLEKSTDYNFISNLVKSASQKDFQHMIGYSEEPLISADLLDCKLPAVFDVNAGMGVNNCLFNLILWYNPQLSHSKRIVDFIVYMSEPKSEEI